MRRRRRACCCGRRRRRNRAAPACWACWTAPSASAPGLVRRSEPFLRHHSAIVSVSSLPFHRLHAIPRRAQTTSSASALDQVRTQTGTFSHMFASVFIFSLARADQGQVRCSLLEPAGASRAASCILLEQICHPLRRAWESFGQQRLYNVRPAEPAAASVGLTAPNPIRSSPNFHRRCPALWLFNLCTRDAGGPAEQQPSSGTKPPLKPRQKASKQHARNHIGEPLCVGNLPSPA